MGIISQSQQGDISKFWRSHYEEKIDHVFSRLGRANNHQIFFTFNSTLISIQETGNRSPVHIQEKVGSEIRKLIQEGHIVKLIKCTSEHFISPIVIIKKNDDTIKLAMDSKSMINQVNKHQYQIPSFLELLDSAA